MSERLKSFPSAREKSHPVQGLNAGVRAIPGPRIGPVATSCVIYTG
jgi:hypothetical protein